MYHDDDDFRFQPSPPLSFRELESSCERLFASSGPFWHLCTPGQSTEFLFQNEEDYRFVMNQQAILASEHHVDIVAFEIMSNHLHDILTGCREDCLAFFSSLKRKLQRYFSAQGRFVQLKGFEANLIPIDNLASLRKEIAYVHRNGFLVYPAFTPFSYPWGSGPLYFNLIPKLDMFPKYSSLTEMQKRAVCKGRAAVLPDCYKVDGDWLLPQTYCNFKLGMSLFRDAQSYFSIISKNYEAYSEVAKRLGDSVFLTDDEMLATMRLVSKRLFDESRVSQLPPAAKLELAKRMRSDYNASEGQIQRMLRLDPGVIRELFGKAQKQSSRV